ncbi:Ig-like domain-containing protein [Aquimarina sp. ERC-38]|uniref:Ig-like domain-containing protein n=1 Tax=Aquimarina sp. ERC-38 TaxID=2949996 RepID=UPI002248308E|nr:Ig-like domain-containing protein [Aquimarina sp. ERC-38]UZO82592.1 Ig-like domain-containing protein [Aquimarina sp. ERC-38]
MKFLTHRTNLLFVTRKRLSLLLFLCTFSFFAQDWKGIPVPAQASPGSTWKLLEAPSDDFNYVFKKTNKRSDFGGKKWYNFYHNGWDGPGTTYWKYNHVSVDGNDLVLEASRWNRNKEDLPPTRLPNKMGRPQDGISSGCITSNSRVKYPVFVEARVSVADIVLASDVWLLSPDDTQEIDVIECYGGNEHGNAFFAEFIHLSHHSFVRQPFTDYQPRDFNSWWGTPTVKNWGEYHWNKGNRRYVRIGVNWISPFHFEYYIDGKLVRVLYDKAVATNRNNTWTYEYPTMTNGRLNFKKDGFQAMTRFQTSKSYSLQTLKKASNASSVSIIDPYNFQKGAGFNKAMDIIINVESQNWHVDAGRTPSDKDLKDPAKNTMKVDWLRVYKPTKGNDNTKIPVTGINLSPATMTLKAGTTRKLAANVTPANATVKRITFTSGNPSVATVNADGVVRAVKAGRAVITAKSVDGNFSKTSTVTVTKDGTTTKIPVTGINLAPATMTLRAGTTRKLAANVTPANATVKRITFTSGNPSVATVNADGMVRAVKAGRAVITAKSVDGNFSKTSTVTVTKGGTTTKIPVTGIRFTPNSLTLKTGATKKLTPAILPANATEKGVTYTSTIPSIATVNSDGVVRALKVGITVITATTKDGGFKATTTVRVIKKPATGGQMPYTGKPSIIPGIINSVEFDIGGQNVAYFDRSPGNEGPGKRQDTDVDTEKRTPAGNVGWILQGEWLEYTVNITKPGFYTFDIQTASPNSNGAFHIEFNGFNATGLQRVKSTGSMNRFVNTRIDRVRLTVGRQVMKIYIDRGGFNLGTMNIVPAELKSALNENDLNQVELYPNPSSGTVYLNGLDTATNSHIRIYDIKGTTYINTTLNNSNEINIENLSQGIYFLSVSQEGKERKTLKLIKN